MKRARSFAPPQLRRARIDRREQSKAVERERERAAHELAVRRQPVSFRAVRVASVRQLSLLRSVL